MSSLFERLAEGLPERHVPRRNSFATDAKSLRQWLGQLPLANPAATSRLLIVALREMNQLRIDPQQRIDALEMLREPVGTIVSSLGRQVIAESFPLPPQKRQLGQLAQDFEHELALGYCAAVHDMCAPAGAVPFLRGKAAALALVRALGYRGGFLYQAYLGYRAPPPGAWQNLHDLFRFAVAVGVDEKPVIESLRGAGQTNVRLAYIHALLFALSNPYRFTQRENSDIYQLTGLWASHCELREGRAPAGAIAIRTDSDRSLGYLPEERETPDAGLWALEISGLVRFLEGHLALLAPGTTATEFGARGASIKVAIDFVARLLRVWDVASDRVQQRLSAGHMLESVIGLHDLHYVLAGGMDFEGFLVKTRGVAITLHESDRAAAWTNASAGPRIRRIPARVLDQSLGGYRLAWDSIDGIRVKVGELLGLAPPADDDESRDWMIGAIRWLRIEGDGSMQAGVELLARRAQPAAVRSFDSNGVPRAAMRALALQDPNGGTPVIVVPALFDRDSGEIELTRPGDPFSWPVEPSIESLRGVRCSDNGGGYFRVEMVAPDTADEAVDAVPAANDDADARLESPA
ncbi:MAG: hypothetical protein ACREPN_01230 [Rudaea sp.]